MTLTIILDLYLMEQGPVPLGSQLVWWMPSKNPDLCGGQKGLHLQKWILLGMLFLSTPYLQLVRISDPSLVSVSLIFQPKLNAKPSFSICSSTVSAYANLTENKL
jgi:hypothetical protein